MRNHLWRVSNSNRRNQIIKSLIHTNIFSMHKFSRLLCLLSFSAIAQRIDVNSITKDAFNGKASEFVYKAKEGIYTFQSYGPAIIKTTFRPNGYTKFEQVSDAVMAKPQDITGKVMAGLSYT